MDMNIAGKIEIETLNVAGIQESLFGMRNPFDSWDKGGSKNNDISDSDMVLAQKLIKGGSEHRKFLRQIQVWSNIKVPRYIWQELDTYKFGTKNSQSTMHTLHKREFNLSDFYLGEDPVINTANMMEIHILPELNMYREHFLSTKDYRYVIEMKRILPESFLQMRTWNTNYEELRNIYHQRKSHRLKDEWTHIIQWIESLPYAKELILYK